MWELRYADEKFVIETKAERKQPLPQWYLDQPELLPGQKFYIEAFDRLTTCRSIYDGVVGRIPWTSTRQYADVYEMDFNDFKMFEMVIEKLDTAYVRWIKDQVPTKEETKKGKTDG